MRNQQRIQHFIVIGILIAANALGAYVYKKWDLTEDKRYTLTKPTVKLLQDVDQVVFVNVLLAGDLPAGFKRLRQATKEMLDEFTNRNGLIHYQLSDPQEGNINQINAVAQNLAKDGIIPTRLRIRDKGEAREKLIYPYAIVNIGNESLAVNLLENERPGIDNELILNNSIGLLEYKFADAIQKLRRYGKPNIIFTSGHDELSFEQTRYIERRLRENYNTAHIDLDSVSVIPDDINLVIVAKPRKAFNDKELFVLDQYFVNGGNAIFLIDQLNVSLDSLYRNRSYIPTIYELNLSSLFFRYGVRIQPNLILDLECTRIPLVVGQLGGRVQTELYPWFYHPLMATLSQHPIVKNIDRVNLSFPSTIDTVRTKASIKKTILLTSSKYTRIQRIPVRINFESAGAEPNPALFNKDPQTVAVLLEGRQFSLFENRVTSNIQEQMRSLGAEFKVQNASSKIMIVSDGDLAKNVYNATTGEIKEIGFNKYENFVFQGNQALLFNTVEYMLDQEGIIEARAKEVKLRMLDVVRAQSESLKWQLINVALPLLILLLSVWGFNALRKRRYAR
jgi:gliding motility-associatede transport system auxiliary component